MGRPRKTKSAKVVEPVESVEDVKEVIQNDENIGDEELNNNEDALDEYLDELIENITEEAANKPDDALIEAPVEEVPVEAPVEEVPVEAPVEEVPVEAPVEEVPVEAPMEEVPVEAPVEEAPVEAPAEEVPAEAPVEEVPVEAPVEEVPVEAPVEEVPVEAPVEEVPVEAPVEEVPVEAPVEEVHVEAPVEEVPVEAPVEEVPAEAPVEEVPAETPAEEVPAEAPVEEVPAEAPVEEVPVAAPVEEVPVEAPVEEVPVEAPVEEVPAEAHVEEIPVDTQADTIATIQQDEIPLPTENNNIQIEIIEDSVPVIPEIIFIIPYRDREKQYDFFSKQMKFILEDYNPKSYKILYIHQQDNREFNRGAIKNIGFITVKNMYPENYQNITLVFNDIDTMPYSKNFLNYKTTTGIVKHFYGFQFTLGGIVSITAGDFEKTNGFPNLWTWGYEDNMLQNRVIASGLTIDRSQFYPLLDSNILHFPEGITRNVNRTEYDTYRANTTEGINTIYNIQSNYDESTGFVNVTWFDTPREEDKSQTFAYDMRNGNMPFKPAINKRGARMRMHF
jgi:N-terminal region of glycosyl transferase group 7/N-terminal domain of galactosyltransferase